MVEKDETLTSSKIQAFLDSHLESRQVNRILHGFPSPRFWQPDTVEIPQLMQQRQQWNTPFPALFSLYLGLPFCIKTDPDRCGYCLFPVEIFEGSPQIDNYLDYLEREGELFRDFFLETTPETIYIGGGTPNLMRPHQYLRLMEIVQKVFPRISFEVPITMEGIPQLFKRDKLVAMKSAGINRVSMGVQQLNPELNRLSGRKQTAQHVFDAVNWCHELGLQCNVDLIFGWPRQTLETMMSDLEKLVATGVDHVAHYELNIGGPTAFSLNYREELPSPSLTREMYQTGRDFLISHGYRQLTVYDFQKDIGDLKFVYEECQRDSERHEMWGWGFAGVTDFGGMMDNPGCSYLNHRRVQDYYNALDRREFPVERAFIREIKDLRLNALFKNLQGLRVERSSYLRRFEIDAYEEHKPIWRALSDRNWCSVTSEAIQLNGDGVYYVPLIQALLSHERLDELQSSTGLLALSAARKHS